LAFKVIRPTVDTASAVSGTHKNDRLRPIFGHKRSHGPRKGADDGLGAQWESQRDIVAAGDVDDDAGGAVGVAFLAAVDAGHAGAGDEVLDLLEAFRYPFVATEWTVRQPMRRKR
jgi:hypothetical protein